VAQSLQVDAGVLMLERGRYLLTETVEAFSAPQLPQVSSNHPLVRTSDPFLSWGGQPNRLLNAAAYCGTQ
jgi:hypothetical protein